MFDFDFVFKICYSFVVVLIFIIQLFKTGSVNKSIKSLEEFMKKYKTIDTRENKPQEFSEEITDYILNPATNELEELPVKKNVQSEIQSYLDCALERALEKYLPKQEVKEDDLVADYTSKVDDLAAFGDVMDLAEEYREKYDLPDNYTLSDIYGFVDKQAKDLKSKLGNIQNSKKEVESNGKSAETSSEQKV